MKKLIQSLKQSGNSNRWFPVHFILALGSLTLLASIALFTGCASSSQQAATRTQQKETVLQQCGFKAVSATTPQQQQQMATLPPDKISVVQRNGTRYYVFPDPKQQMLYVGRDDQFLRYQNYLSNQAENAQYDAISRGDPGVAKYNNAAEALSGNENLMNWDNGSWAPWDSH